MKKYIILWIIASVSILFYACSSCNRDGNKKADEAGDTTEPYEMLPSEQQSVIDVVYKWNAAHDSTKIDSLNNFYSDPVLLKWFQEEYAKECRSKLDMGKSCIRFKKLEDLNFKVAAELVAESAKLYEAGKLFPDDFAVG